jgi:hypothetical protein
MNLQEEYCKLGSHDWNFYFASCSNCGILYVDYINSKLPIDNQCECGSDSVGHPGHDWFCPKDKKGL